MDLPPLQNNPITESDRQQYADGVIETTRHMWGKRALEEIYGSNPEVDVHIERYLGKRRPDGLIEAPIRTTADVGYMYQGAAVEIVAESDQAVLMKTRNALRCGYVVYWVLPANEDTSIPEELDPFVSESIDFGRYDPDSGKFSLGDPITLQNFNFEVSDFMEFAPGYLRGPGWGPHWDIRIGFLVGEFLFNGDRRRVYCRSNCGRAMRSHPPDRDPEPGPLAEEKYNFRDVYHMVKHGEVKRVGPTAGYRRKRYADTDGVSNAYLAPKKVSRICYKPHRL